MAVAQDAGNVDVVLDLACGDGPLLELLSATSLVAGGDFSVDELTAAQRRLGEHTPLVRLHAAWLPFRSRCLDAVVCHFALMLLQPLDAVIVELARVLRNGGRFAAALPATPAEDEPSGGVFNALRAALSETTSLGGTVLTALQDDRALDSLLLCRLLEDEGFGNVVARRHDLSRPMPLPDAAARLSLTYAPGLLSASDRARFDEALTRHLRRQANTDGEVLFVSPVEIVTAVRAS